MIDWQPLSLVEQSDLKRYEETIRRGLDTFVAVGNALLAIKRDNLWREEHGSFDAYVTQRWQMTGRYANNLIGAAQVVGNLETIAPGELGTIVPILPATESQARPLVGLPTEQQREVWTEVIGSAPNGVVTAAHVQTVVEQYRSEIKPSLAIHFSSDTPEHYTPLDVLKGVVLCLGTIDLDPCSNSHDAPHVPANKHYTKEDDGLGQPWHGRIFMNPPYGDEIAKWVDKLCREEALGNVTEAIALVPARTDTDWFDQLIDGYRFVCYVHGRLKFVDSTGRVQGSAPFPSAIVYFGTDFGRFYYNFAAFGRIAQEVNREISFGS